MTSPLNEPPGAARNENNDTDEINDEEMGSKGGADITVPGNSENESSEAISSPRGVKYNLRPNS